jgi:hypothetical protein
MTNKELTSLAIRVFAIYVLVQTISLAAQSASAMSAYFQGDQKWLVVLPILSIIGLSVFFYMLWKLSQSVFKEVSTKSTTEDGYKLDQTFVLQLVGFYLIMVSLFGLAHGGLSLYHIYIQQAQEYGSTYRPEMSSQSILYLVESSLKLLVGISLVIKSTGWIKLFNRFRRIGVANKP